MLGTLDIARVKFSTCLQKETAEPSMVVERLKKEQTRTKTVPIVLVLKR